MREETGHAVRIDDFKAVRIIMEINVGGKRGRSQ